MPSKKYRHKGNVSSAEGGFCPGLHLDLSASTGTLSPWPSQRWDSTSAFTLVQRQVSSNLSINLIWFITKVGIRRHSNRTSCRWSRNTRNSSPLQDCRSRHKREGLGTQKVELSCSSCGIWIGQLRYNWGSVLSNLTVSSHFCYIYESMYI